MERIGQIAARDGGKDVETARAFVEELVADADGVRDGRGKRRAPRRSEPYERRAFRLGESESEVLTVAVHHGSQS